MSEGVSVKEGCPLLAFKPHKILPHSTNFNRIYFLNQNIIFSNIGHFLTKIRHRLYFYPPVRPFSFYTPVSIFSVNSGFTLLRDVLEFFFCFLTPYLVMVRQKRNKISKDN